MYFSQVQPYASLPLDFCRVVFEASLDDVKADAYAFTVTLHASRVHAETKAYTFFVSSRYRMDDVCMRMV